MFRVHALKAEAEADLRLRHLHSLFDDDDSNNRAHNDLTSNSTADFSDHYYPPAADGDGGPSITSNTYTMSSAPTNHTQSNNNIDELSDNRRYLSQSLPLDIICLIIGIVFIVLFCSKRHRHSVGNEESSTPAANRAAEQRKLEELEERKKRIGEVLVSRLIVEDEEENVVTKVVYFENKGGRKDEGISANNAAAAGGFHDRSEDNEENQVVNDRDQGQGGENYDDEEMGMKEAVAEDKTLAQDEDAAAGALVTIPSTEETTVATVPSSSSEETHGNKSPSDSSCLTTITLSTIQQTYGEEECIICFSNFQVGDLVAWSKHQINGCTHVFHDDCLTRWLLVRDCCPMCRRSYGVVG
jgi:hypothetical protein